MKAGGQRERKLTSKPESQQPHFPQMSDKPALTILKPWHDKNLSGTFYTLDLILPGTSFTAVIAHCRGFSPQDIFDMAD